jgi:mannose-1-phosphate guanylyltransferase
MTAAMVLCAGLGTRLDPLTRELAKPLMPVGDRPVLAHILELLDRGGVTRFVVNTHHRPQDFARDLRQFGREIRLSHEPKILGTAGGVAHAATEIGQGPVIVWNGDILAHAFDVTELLAAQAGSGHELVWVVAPAPAGSGTVGLDAEEYVVRLRGERFGEEASGGDFLGVQIMGPEIRRALPQEGCLVADVALPFLRRGGRIASLLHRGDWDDIGQPTSLLRANLRWLERRGLRAWVAEDAIVGDAVMLDRCVVGQGAAISGAGTLRESVLFPGARLSAPAARMLVAPNVALEVPQAG